MTRDRTTLPRLRAVVRLAGWTAVLLVAGRVLVAAGTGSLSVPLGSLDELSAWVSETPPADMAVGLARLAGLAAVGYLLAATALTIVADQVRARPLVTLAEALSPAVVRRIATGGSGLGLVLGGAVASLPTPDLHPGVPTRGVALTAADPGTPAAPDPLTATMSRLPAATATMARLPTARATASPATAARNTTLPGEAEATMARLDDESDAEAEAEAEATMTPLPTGEPVPATPAAHRPDASDVGVAGPPASPDVDPTLWVVEPGDSFWSIAEEVTAESAGRAGEREVMRYWQRLIDANRADLVDPDNPDLLVPGQRLVVPPPDVAAPP